MFQSVIDLFFPKICYACLKPLRDNETTICVTCRHNLPVTNFHFKQDETVKKVLYGRAELENATALFRFEKKGLVQELLHGLKYRGYETIGITLGNWLGSELKTLEAYKAIDMVIPVPLHKKKLRQRGYNQVAEFGRHIALQLKVPYRDDLLLKITNTKSQVNKKRFSRWGDTDTLFALQNTSELQNKHILLVDDIITTGATLEACANVLKKAENIKISIATIAIA